MNSLFAKIFVRSYKPLIKQELALQPSTVKEEADFYRNTKLRGNVGGKAQVTYRSGLITVKLNFLVGQAPYS